MRDAEASTNDFEEPEEIRVSLQRRRHCSEALLLRGEGQASLQFLQKLRLPLRKFACRLVVLAPRGVCFAVGFFEARSKTGQKSSVCGCCSSEHLVNVRSKLGLHLFQPPQQRFLLRLRTTATLLLVCNARLVFVCLRYQQAEKSSLQPLDNVLHLQLQSLFPPADSRKRGVVAEQLQQRPSQRGVVGELPENGTDAQHSAVPGVRPPKKPREKRESTDRQEIPGVSLSPPSLGPSPPPLPSRGREPFADATFRENNRGPLAAGPAVGFFCAAP